MNGADSILRLRGKILESRGIVYTRDELDALWNNRMRNIGKAWKEEKAWLYAGYFFAALGGFFGILIGLVLMQSSKTLPDGRKVYSYDEATRKKAKLIVIVSMLVFMVVVFGKFWVIWFAYISIFERPVLPSF